jgi:hypothetical protein
MDIQRRWVFSMMSVIALITLTYLCRADDSARDRQTLRGIQAVIVKIHYYLNSVI